MHFLNNFKGLHKKKQIITREYAYHGSTLLSASVSGKPADRGNMDLITSFIHHLPAPNPYRRPAGMSVEAYCDQVVGDLERKILELGHENVDCFIAELHRLSDGVTQAELDRAKIGLKAGTIMQGESTSARAGSLAHDWWMRGRLRTLDEIKSAIDAITVDQVNAYQKKNKPGPFTIVTVGPKALDLPK